MASATSLIQMPEDPMEHILEYLDFPLILILRKTCHDLRNFIDNKKPASRLTGICVYVNPKIIKFYLKSEAQSKIRIVYEKCNEGCLIKKYHEDEEIKRTILENEDFVAVFCKDFDIILRHQKTVLRNFEINCNSPNSTTKERVLESVDKSSKSMNHLLQVKSLHLMMSNHNEILTVLPYIDPKSLEVININESSINENIVLNLNEIGQLEQWKQAKDLVITGFQIPYLSQNFEHFSSIDLGCRDVSLEELISLKEIFLSSSTLHKMKIFISRYCSAFGDPGLIERFGEPFIDTHQDENWFFRIPDTIQFLRITHYYCYITFNRIEQSDVGIE